MSEKEEFLIAMVKANSKDMAIQYLQYYIQRNGFLSNEAGEEIRRILAEKD